MIRISDIQAVIASEAKQSISPQQERMDCFVASLLAMTKGCESAISPPVSREVWLVRSALHSEGAGKAGCRLHPWVPCNKKHGGRTTGSTGITPAFPAQWFTAYTALSPVTGLSCHCRRRNLFRQLDASVGESGPHGFAVRINAVRHRRIRVHRIPLHVRDDRERPSERNGTAGL